MATRDEVTQLARNLHEAGLLDLDKPIREALLPAPVAGDGEEEALWNAVFGSSYVLVRNQ